MAQLVTLRREDCGPCLQIGVNQAQQAKIDAGLLSTVLAGNYGELSEELQEVVKFTESIASA
ncbi:hypothetical protein [Adhaeretor mobilis]|uniref:Uncharacterized protein n=1 Tax=Adhaeretor mobilis TaxID=1930276 RepID=A0A517MR83_9BACT|nr:hypothetical protein [Adhaeretor mobilis]QDS97307.1 hypothetical protein HG15A2_05680 [Adhaeretor mobilis]